MVFIKPMNKQWKFLGRPKFLLLIIMLSKRIYKYSYFLGERKYHNDHMKTSFKKRY